MAKLSEEGMIDRYSLNDQQVNSIINRRYNPEGETINEDSRERTYDLSGTNTFAETKIEVN